MKYRFSCTLELSDDDELVNVIESGINLFDSLEGYSSVINSVIRCTIKEYVKKLLSGELGESVPEMVLDAEDGEVVYTKLKASDHTVWLNPDELFSLCTDVTMEQFDFSEFILTDEECSNFLSELDGYACYGNPVVNTISRLLEIDLDPDKLEVLDIIAAVSSGIIYSLPVHLIGEVARNILDTIVKATNTTINESGKDLKLSRDGEYLVFDIR